MAPVPPVLWRPPAQPTHVPAITRYMRWLEAERGHGFADYPALWQWSVDDLEGFWASIWDHFEVAPSTSYERVLAADEMPGASWFPGARLNYAEHVLRCGDDDAVAILYTAEGEPLREMTWSELRDLVAHIAAGLRRLGVTPGDRVVGYLPNVPEAVAALLACASIGAVWSSCSPDFGTRSVVDRFSQLAPKVLFAVDGYRYGGRRFDRSATIDELRTALPSLEHTVVLPYLDEDARIDGTLDFHDFTDGPAELVFHDVPFDHPLWVLWSSGTTGLPKGITHGHGGVLLEQLKLAHLHVDLHPGDRVFWFTTTGWMMWNFLVGCLLTNAAIVLFDGNPGHPDMGVLWDLAERAGVTCFGTSASFISASMKTGVHPAAGRDLSRLRSVGATGSPLSADSFQWIADELGEDTWLFSMSGGSDLCTAFVGGCPVLPVYRGELQCRALGASVEAWDPDGRPLVGEVGELVLTRPMPSMPVYLWNDDDGQRYRDSYFSMYPGVWRHGDWIEITERGTAVISGRSDSTINRGGIRMGTSEIYAAVLDLEEIADALVVDVHADDGEAWMPLFVVLAHGAVLDSNLERRIGKQIRDNCSPRHVPDEAFAVAELPRTLSGKTLEVPVKRILQGADPETAVSREALANPRALDWFIELAASRRGTQTQR
jgi:acetoacetyl-CoA synthetase